MKTFELEISYPVRWGDDIDWEIEYVEVEAESEKEARAMYPSAKIMRVTEIS